MEVRAARFWTENERRTGEDGPAFVPSLPPLSASIILCRTLRTILGREEKKRGKVGQGDLFFFPQFTEAEGGGVIVS